MSTEDTQLVGTAPQRVQGLGERRVDTYRGNPVMRWDGGCYAVLVPEDSTQPLAIVYDGEHPSRIGALEWKQQYGATMGRRLWLSARRALVLREVTA